MSERVMTAERLRFSHATLEMIAKSFHMLEQSAHERFLSTGRNNDAEEWHKVRHAKDEVDTWLQACRR